MSYQTVGASFFKKLVTNGAINLKNNYAYVDELNVFPVPDGDTGTNMSMTIMSGINEIENYESNSLADVSKTFSRGLLMGARGNSGVILSQFFRGVSLGMKEIQGSSATLDEFINALVSGYRVAYQAVMAPVEGTILTVMREAGQELEAKKGTFESVDQILKCYFEKATESLNHTPEILPVLKEAGVVDSGGAGFTKVVEGMYLASIGKMLEMIDEDSTGEAETKEEVSVQEETVESKFTYKIEFELMIKDKDFNVSDLRSPLSIIGDSLKIEEKADTVYVSFFTNNPGRALSMGQRHGEFKLINISNIKLPKEEEKKPEEVKGEASEYAIICCCFGDGIKDAFRNLGATNIVDGGQTMNPSTEDFVKAINTINANNIIIIPNNSNIIMASNQAKELCSDRNIEVLATKNLVHGFAALASFDEEATLEENLEAMNEAIANATSIEITYAVRDTEISGVKINKDDYMAIVNNKILASTKERYAACKKALTASIKKDSIVTTIFKGKDASDEEINKMKEYIEILNPDCDVEVIDGGQDIYSYIICVE